nr:MAG TPA: hypothetical protein [Caudoviricetes sp.]
MVENRNNSIRKAVGRIFRYKSRQTEGSSSFYGRWMLLNS